MKLSSAALPLLLLVASPQALPRALPARPPAAQPPAAQEVQTFRDKLKAALRIGASDEVTRLVRQNEEATVAEVMALCEAIAIEGSDELEDLIAALRKAWKEIYETEFVDNMYEFFSLLRVDLKRTRAQILNRYAVDIAAFQKAEDTGDSNALNAIGLNFQAYGAAFEEIGDYYNASQSYLNYGLCFDESRREQDADPRRAFEGQRKAVELREKIGLLDAPWKVAKARMQDLEAAGYGDSPPPEAPSGDPPAGETPPAGGEAGGAEAPPAPAPAAAPAEPALVSMAFEVADDPEEPSRPHYTLDTAYQMWSSLSLGAAAAAGEAAPSVKFSSFVSEASPVVLRTAAAKAGVDYTGDGQVDVEIPLTGKITPVQVEIGKDDARRPWAFLATIGRTEDTYQGFQFNLEVSDQYMGIYFAPAASVGGLLGSKKIRVFDDNMDGIYGSLPLTWGYIGLADGSFQPDMDAILVEGEKAARPWSSLFELDGAWYRLEAERGGLVLRATPASPKLGWLKLDYGGGDADWVVVQGNAPNDTLFLRLEQGKKVAAPIGGYKLFAGEISTGKDDQLNKALMLATPRTPFFEVREGQTTDVKLGAPYTFAFDFKQDATSLTVVGKSVVVEGRGNESYQRLWNCVLMPDVLVRKAGSKKGKEVGGMRPIQSQEELADKNNDYVSIWFPQDLVHEKKVDEVLEVQLVSKKHKLFKKIESDWQTD
jgi:hypothetical protein